MIILIGPSASGKTEIAKELFRLYGIKKVVTHTTREKRIHEINDIDYHFVTKDVFLKMKEKNMFIETTFYNNNYYGTSKDEIKNDKVLIVDPSGKDAFLKLNNKSIKIFYLLAKEETRRKRMIERKDNKALIEQRITKDRTYFDKNSQFGANYIINTENKTVEELAKYIYSLYISK